MRSLQLEHASVIERAALICLDVLDDKRPDDPSAWSKQKLLVRIASLKAGKLDPARAQPAANPPRTPHRVEQSQQVRQWLKVDRSEARRDEIARQERIRLLRETELAEERKRLELAQAAIRAEESLPPEIRAIRKRIAELSGMIATKENTLFTDTLNERAHDRIYESLQRDREDLAALQKALTE
jgi:hypothetical protein